MGWKGLWATSGAVNDRTDWAHDIEGGGDDTARFPEQLGAGLLRKGSPARVRSEAVQRRHTPSCLSQIKGPPSAPLCCQKILSVWS